MKTSKIEEMTTAVSGFFTDISLPEISNVLSCALNCYVDTMTKDCVDPPHSIGRFRSYQPNDIPRKTE